MARLITTIPQLQEYVRVNNGLQMQTVTPALNEVELQTLSYYLGTDLLNIIIAEHEAQVFTPRIEAIYPYVLQALANIAVYKAVNEIEVQVSDQGINRMESTSEKTAYGGQIVRYKETIGNRGYASIDEFLLIISTNSAQYPEWNSSQYYAVKQGLLFSSASDFSRYENIKDSALTFQALATFIKDSLESIDAALPAEMYDNIMSASPSAENLVIIDKYIKPALAKMAMTQALILLPVSVDHQGVLVNQLELQGDARTKRMAPNAFIERKMDTLMKSAKAHMAKMAEFLNENASASAYTVWFNDSDFYEETLASKIANNSLSDDERRVYRA